MPAPVRIGCEDAHILGCQITLEVSEHDPVQLGAEPLRPAR